MMKDCISKAVDVGAGVIARAARIITLLTDDFGVPALQHHLYATQKFMEASATWENSYRLMQRAFPKLNSNLVLNFPDDDDAPAKTG